MIFLEQCSHSIFCSWNFVPKYQHRHGLRRRPCKKFILPFEVDYEVKHLWESSFQVHLLAFLGGFNCCLAPASEERSSTLDVISGILKAHKAESCSLQVCKFVIRNPIRDHFLEIFCKLESTFKKFGWKFVFSSIAKCIL